MTVPKRVLVVDDDARIREFISRALVLEGYSVETAADGELALEMLPNIQPELILLDMRMPNIDGKEFMRRYRQQDGIVHAPVIVLTAAHETVPAGELLHAAGYLPKPFDLDELLNIVERLTNETAN
jgi:DNA-binding response OmpR family regulator